MRTYLSPGAYVAPELPAREDLRLVRTDIAGFVGYAERGPVSVADLPDPTDPAKLAIRLTSWSEYRDHFGGLTRHGYMPYAVRAFFENGGTTCYVVRVAAGSSRDPLAVPRAAAFDFPTGDDAMQVTALTAALAENDKAAAVKVDSTAGLLAGSVVGFGTSAAALQIRTVANVVDAQTLALDAPLETKRAAGSPVWLLNAATLPTGAIAGQTDIRISNTAAFQTNDTVALSCSGATTIAAVDAILDATTLRLKDKLKGKYPNCTLVRLQTTGMRIEAASPGNWGNRLKIEMTPRTPGDAVKEFDLRVTLAPGPDPTQPAEVENFRNLSLDPKLPQFAPNVVNDPKDGSRLIRLAVPPSVKVLQFRDGRVDPEPRITGGRDGLAGVTARDFIGGEDDFRGLRVLEEIAEVGILVAPDAVNAGRVEVLPVRPKPDPNPCKPPAPPPPLDTVADDLTALPPALPEANAGRDSFAIYRAMADQAYRLRYRVAVLDIPDAREPNDAAKWLATLDLPPSTAPFAAAYYPWILVPDGIANDRLTRRVPAGGHVAGVYARIDNAVGVQHPPANAELDFAVDVGRHLSDDLQGPLNDLGINVIRSFPGRGIRVWGARSVAADPEYDLPQWWFIHIRRTLSMIEATVERSTQWTVFEPNDFNLRRTLAHSLTVLLEQLWQAGGLKGSRIDEAFYVKCDGTNNPQSVVDEGRLICEVGVAIAAPMEFLTFQVLRLPDGTAVVEG